MATIFDKNLSPLFDSIKDSDEEIKWVGYPKLLPFIFYNPQIILYSFILGPWFFIANKNEKVLLFDLSSSQVIGIVFILIGVGKIIYNMLLFTNTCFAYSQKRVMIRTGFFGTDFKVIDYDKISDIEVNVSFIERIFNVGSIRFFSGRTNENKKIYDAFISIDNPYKMLKTLKEIVTDVKADIHYPNALRPDTNPGYKTKYEKK